MSAHDDHVLAALAGRRARKAALHRALGAVPAQPAERGPEAEERTGGFDGGARITPEAARSPQDAHAESLRQLFGELRRSGPAPRW